MFVNVVKKNFIPNVCARFQNMHSYIKGKLSRVEK